METTIVELTGCSWKQASTALQSIQNDSNLTRRNVNDDEIISAACELVIRDLEAERQRCEEAERQRREAERQRQIENRMEESKTMTLTSEYLSYGKLKGCISNVDNSRIPDVLSANGVSIETWGKVFTASVEVFEKLQPLVNVYVSAQPYPTDGIDASIAVSNFIAKANFFLNPHGILVQVEKRFEAKKLLKKKAVFGQNTEAYVDHCLVLIVTFEHIKTEVFPAAVAVISA